jgi:hypothetical protein
MGSYEKAQYFNNFSHSLLRRIGEEEMRRGKIVV